MLSSVAPYAGAWIETNDSLGIFKVDASLPTRERGLKQMSADNFFDGTEVAPYAGAWIETKKLYLTTPKCFVAPYAGAWIETKIDSLIKCVNRVAPYAGAWIETGQGASAAGQSSLPTRERGLKPV